MNQGYPCSLVDNVYKDNRSKILDAQASKEREELDVARSMLSNKKSIISIGRAIGRSPVYVKNLLKTKGGNLCEY